MDPPPDVDPYSYAGLMPGRRLGKVSKIKGTNSGSNHQKIGDFILAY